MPQVDLSSLSGSELRALLNATRERGEAAQSYRILQEMAARRGDSPAPPGARRPPEPRVIEVDLGDPLDREAADDEDDVPPLPPNWKPTPPRTPAPAAARPAAKPAPRATPQPAAKVAPPPKPKPAPAAEEPLPPIAAVHFRDVVTDKDPEPLAWDLPPPGREPPSSREPRPRARHTAAILAAGLVVGIGLGVVVGEAFRAPPRQPTVAAFRAAAQPQPQLQPAAQTETAPPPAPYPEAPPDTAPQQAAPPDTAPPDTAPAEASEPAPAPPQAGGCAAATTPADRTICGSAELRRLQRELRQAYAQALAVHHDRDLLREHQLAWASARDGVTDPHALARLYSERIRKLNAATQDARRKG